MHPKYNLPVWVYQRLFCPIQTPSVSNVFLNASKLKETETLLSFQWIPESADKRRSVCQTPMLYGSDYGIGAERHEWTVSITFVQNTNPSTDAFQRVGAGIKVKGVQHFRYRLSKRVGKWKIIYICSNVKINTSLLLRAAHIDLLNHLYVTQSCTKLQGWH